MGAWSDDGGTSVLNNVGITTSGESGIGVFAIAEQVGSQFNANTTTNRTTVETTGLNAHGAQAQSRNDQPVEVATVTLNDTSIITRGTGAAGLRAVLENYGSLPTGRGECGGQSHYRADSGRCWPRREVFADLGNFAVRISCFYSIPPTDEGGDQSIQPFLAPDS